MKLNFIDEINHDKIIAESTTLKRVNDCFDALTEDMDNNDKKVKSLTEIIKNLTEISQIRGKEIKTLTDMIETGGNITTKLAQAGRTIEKDVVKLNAKIDAINDTLVKLMDIIIKPENLQTKSNEKRSI